MKDKYHLRMMLKDVCDFVESHEKATYDLGYKLTLKKDDAVIDKVTGIADARIKLDHILSYVPQYTPSTQQQSILSKQMLGKTPTELEILNDLFL